MPKSKTVAMFMLLLAVATVKKRSPQPGSRDPRKEAQRAWSGTGGRRR